MKIKINRIVISLIIVMISLVGLGNVSMAVTKSSTLENLKSMGKDAVGKTITKVTKSGGNVNLYENNDLYCIEYGQSLSGIHTYKVQEYIEINGKTATIYNSSNGTPVVKKDSSFARMAYLIGGGDEGKYGWTNDVGYWDSTLRQKAIWQAWNKFITKINGNSHYTYQSNDNLPYAVRNSRIGLDGFNKEADNYAANIKDTSASIKLQNGKGNVVTSTTTSDGAELIPIKISFTGTLKEIVVLDSSNKEISELQFFNSSRKQIKNSDIKSGEMFYIKANKKVSTVKFKVNGNEKNINAKIWIIDSQDGATQRLIFTDSKFAPSEVSLDVKVNSNVKGDLQIQKEDKSTQKKLAGAEFKIKVGDKDQWLGINPNTKEYVYDSSYKDAKTFVTDVNGNISISNLVSGISVRVYETKAPEGYKLEEQENYDEKTGIVFCNAKKYTVGKNKTINVKQQNTKTGNIQIRKLDSKTEQRLSGAGFKISAKVQGDKNKNVWLKQNADGTFSYTESFEKATTFTSSSDGIVNVKELEPQDYYVYEVKAPKGYDITSQNKYDINNQWVNCGKTTVNSGKTVEVGLTNEKLIAIEGFVWVDKPQNKANSYNDIFDTAESIITNNVTITLRNKSDNSVVASNPKIITKKVNGVDVAYYRFEKINYNNLKDYYVHFDYSKQYGNYITVAKNFDIKEGSKALSDDVAEYDKDLVAMATTYKGNDKESAYGLSGLANKFYNESTYTLEYVNLGIKELPETSYSVTETPAYTELKIKGYNYKYIHGGQGKEIKTVPTVRYESENIQNAYGMAIYPADIQYTDTDKTRELQAFVTYRIDITNTTATQVPYLYQEQYLNVKSVTNKFDTDRYELADDNWTLTKDSDVAQIKEEYLRKQYFNSNGTGISGSDSKVAYITFKIKDNVLKDLLNNKNGSIEKTPTTATVTANHNYTRIDSSWKNNFTKTQTHYTNDDTKSESSKFLRIKLGENRKVSGKVFEDTNSKDNGEFVGDGIDNNENKVSGVTVELGNYDGNEFVVTDLYQADGNRPKATTKTDNEGKYSFEGVVPGEYFVRFTYGDGTQKIVGANEKAVSSIEYKSTIVSDTIKNAYEKYEPTKATWYLQSGENHNTAVDKDISASKEVTFTSKTVSEQKGENVIAETPQLSIPIEFTETNESDVAVEQNGEMVLRQYPNELGYLDFGIIQRPAVNLNINKKITNVKLTLQNGNVIFDGNPAEAKIAYVADLDGKTSGGSKYVKAEMNSEYIYGSTLDIQYEITVLNDSDLDYIEDDNDAHFGYYYKYGIKDYAKTKTIKVNNVYDYLDPKVSYESKEGTQDVNKIDVSSFKADELTAEQQEILTLVNKAQDKTQLKYNTVLDLTNWKELKSSKEGNSVVSSDTVKINVKKLMSSEQEDLEFINVAEVVKATTKTNAKGIRLGSSSAQGEFASLGQSETITATVTPSTGGNRSILYFVVGAIALIVLAGGVVVIRKINNKN